MLFHSLDGEIDDQPLVEAAHLGAVDPPHGDVVRPVTRPPIAPKSSGLVAD